MHAADDATRRELVRSGAGIAALEREAGLRLQRERQARLWRPLPRLRCPLSFAYARHRKEDPSIRAARAAVRAVWRRSGR